MKKINILMWGLGEIGSRAGRIIASRPELHISGAISHQVGSDLGTVLGIPETGVTVVAGPEQLAHQDYDICLLATFQRVEELRPQIEWLLSRGISVIVSGEEMIFPGASSPQTSEHLDSLAKANNCSVYGTGVNPGFVMDALVLCLTSVFGSIDRIDVERSSDFSPYGPGPLRSLGVGLTEKEFESGLANGTVDGHIGFRESMAVITKALGWELDSYREGIEPILTPVERRTPHIVVPAGNVAGCSHWMEGLSGGEVKIRLEHPQQIDPAAVDARLGDFVTITGDPGLSMAISPEIEGGQATAARMVNAIHDVLSGPTGLVTMDELRIPFARVGVPQGGSS